METIRDIITDLNSIGYVNMNTKTRKKVAARLEQALDSNAVEVLGAFEYESLIAALRYYEYGQTISSSSYPCDVIMHYWSSKRYEPSVLMKIARQFYSVDHGLRGEKDWTDKQLCDCDKLSWCKFYAFCKAYCNGFKNVTLEGISTFTGKVERNTVEAFYCEYTDKWHPVVQYLANPYINCYCAKENIKEIK